MTQKKWHVIVFVFSFLFFPLSTFHPPFSFASGIARIDRLKIEEQLLPGETKEGKVRVTNSQEEVMHLKIYVQDWIYTPAGDGSKEFAPPAIFPQSCSGWIHLYPDRLTLIPGSSQEVRYTIAVPPDSKGGYQSVIFFENLLGESEQEGGRTVNISARLASLVYVEVRGTVKRQGTVHSLNLTRTKDSKSLQMKLQFENMGNCHLMVEPTFNLLSEKGALVARGSFPKIFTLPGNSVESATTWLGNLPEGIYDLVLTIDLGENQILVKEWKITVPATGIIQENLS